MHLNPRRSAISARADPVTVQRPPLHGDTGPGRIHAVEMIPRALGAHFDDEAGHRVLPLPVPVELRLRADTPPPGGQASAEHERHVDQVHPFTDRARFSGGPPQVPSGPQELWMGVAHVEPGQPSLVEVAHHRVAGQEELDTPARRRRRHACDRSGPKGHLQRVTRRRRLRSLTQRHRRGIPMEPGCRDERGMANYAEECCTDISD